MLFLLTSAITACILLRTMLNDIAAQNRHDIRAYIQFRGMAIGEPTCLRRGCKQSALSSGYCPKHEARMPYLDLAATGAQPFLVHEDITAYADGIVDVRRKAAGFDGESRGGFAAWSRRQRVLKSLGRENAPAIMPTSTVRAGQIQLLDLSWTDSTGPK